MPSPPFALILTFGKFLAEDKEREIIARLNRACFANYILVEEQQRKAVWLPGMKKRKIFRSHTDSVRSGLFFTRPRPPKLSV